MSSNMDDVRLYYKNKFSEILKLEENNNIIINLENALYQHIKTKNSESISGETIDFRREYIKNGRKLIANMTYTPNSNTVKNNILDNIWDPNDIPGMNHEELYPELYFKLKIKQQKKMIKQVPTEEEPDGLIRCRKCKSMKTVYTQAQTRSADEPMTTFVTCLSCDGHFKF